MKHTRNNNQLAVRTTTELLKRAVRNQVALEEDRRCEYFAQLGFSNRLIRKHLGYTDYQIQRRLKRANIKRVDYRDGLSAIGKAVVQKLDAISERKLVQHIERYLLK